jgi:site-specific recombinase XerD
MLNDESECVTCSRFLERMAVRGLSVHTTEAYAYDLAILHRWLEAEELTLTDLTVDDVHRFLASERGRESHPKSINRRLHTLRLYYRFVVGRDLVGAVEVRSRVRGRRRDHELGLQVLPVRTVRQLRVREPRTVVDPLTVEQVRDLVGSLRRYRDVAIAYAMLFCGLRSQEVLRMRVGDVDFEDGRIRVFGKGQKERAIPLPHLLATVLRRYIRLERPDGASSDRVFVILQGARRGDPMSRAALRRVFRTRRMRPLLGNANPHRLRHTFGTDMARSGVRLPILQKMMGHAFPETTLQYVNISLADVATEFHRAITSLQRRYDQDDGGAA